MVESYNVTVLYLHCIHEAQPYRWRAIERIGLPEVRNYRLTHLAQQESAWRQAITQQTQAEPELQALLILHVEGTGG